MNKYEFYSKLLQEDFPVKYRQDFAEHDSEQCKKIHHLKAQLAEAVGLLRYSQEIARMFDDEHTAEVGRFLARYTQVEQQE